MHTYLFSSVYYCASLPRYCGRVVLPACWEQDRRLFEHPTAKRTNVEIAGTRE